ncbi:hypothetical protein EVAR_81886_1 [Eumeta japonica]|uniref:Uncharacterized protein n=1 Tax=Eumeta variegata TaxID=151549 RepID=A0A4C1UX14_EUMVA|nr:hypothetical protein EVAR_81886_1 [Eumeta japonica]
MLNVFGWGIAGAGAAVVGAAAEVVPGRARRRQARACARAPHGRHTTAPQRSTLLCTSCLKVPIKPDLGLGNGNEFKYLNSDKYCKRTHRGWQLYPLIGYVYSKIRDRHRAVSRFSSPTPKTTPSHNHFISERAGNCHRPSSPIRGQVRDQLLNTLCKASIMWLTSTWITESFVDSFVRYRRRSRPFDRHLSKSQTNTHASHLKVGFPNDIRLKFE